ncbi:MAG TPA: aminotransferase class III-fold pyridoxal phosphate-dependent enzyme, partial [Actinomycetota bacterium]|nr:aminotransferase class III-fold pyridoxal phosphate-dependent enzyme [Actinomycetota bacterium]
MGSIKITTKIPGPRSLELARRGLAAIASPLVPGGEVFAADGLGAVIEDVDGNRYLDFIGGVGCVVTGHNHPRVVDAIHGQVDAFIHTDFSILPYETYVSLAERLSAASGGDRKCGFFNSGAEAVENAVKIARGVTGRPGIICFEGAFHGRTLMGMSLTHREVPYKTGFGPFAPEIYRAPYAGFNGSTLDQAIPRIKGLFAEHSIAAVIIEPILGEGGFVPAEEGFLEALSRICAESGAALIVDEIQTGYGRTGSFIASDLVGVRPDIIILGKSIASGLPLSAVVGSAEWMDVLERNTLGGTYVGNPVACAAALAVLDVIE